MATWAESNVSLERINCLNSRINSSFSKVMRRSWASKTGYFFFCRIFWELEIELEMWLATSSVTRCASSGMMSTATCVPLWSCTTSGLVQARSSTSPVLATGAATALISGALAVILFCWIWVCLAKSRAPSQLESGKETASVMCPAWSTRTRVQNPPNFFRSGGSENVHQ